MSPWTQQNWGISELTALTCLEREVPAKVCAPRSFSILRHRGGGEGQGISAPVSQRARKATKQGSPRQTPTGHGPSSSSVKIRGNHRSR